jgi:glycosidase
LFNYVQEVIALRKQNPALRRGDYKRLWSADGIYAFSRSLEGKTLIVALNVSESLQQAEVSYEAQEKPNVVFGEASDISAVDGRLKFKIPARCGAVLK